MKTPTILVGKPLVKTRFGRRVGAAKKCMNSSANSLGVKLVYCLSMASEEVVLGPSDPSKEEKKGQYHYSNPKSHLTHFLGQMVWYTQHFERE